MPVLVAVDHVPDVVQIAGNSGEIGHSRWIVHPLQHIVGNARHQAGVTLSMFGVADSLQLLVDELQYDLYLTVPLQIINGNDFHCTSLSSLNRSSSPRGIPTFVLATIESTDQGRVFPASSPVGSDAPAAAPAVAPGAGTLVAVGGALVAVGGAVVAVGGAGVAVAGTAVAVGGTAVAVGGTAVAVGGTGVAVGGVRVVVGAGVVVPPGVPVGAGVAVLALVGAGVGVRAGGAVGAGGWVGVAARLGVGVAVASAPGVTVAMTGNVGSAVLVAVA